MTLTRRALLAAAGAAALAPLARGRAAAPRRLVAAPASARVVAPDGPPTDVTAFPHPIHLHGHPMRVLTVDGRAAPRPTWRDTLLIGPRARASVALVADNPGRWMLHCHIPEHQEAGMMAVVEVG